MLKQVAAHPELALAEYRQLPELLEHGLVVAGSDGSLQVIGILVDADGQRRAYRAIVRRTASGEALFLVSFHRANGRRVRQALAAAPIRDQTELRGLQFATAGLVE